MKRLLIGLLAASSFAAWGSEGGPLLDRFPKERVTDVAALQNGAKLFVNYCLNCHGASYAAQRSRSAAAWRHRASIPISQVISAVGCSASVRLRDWKHAHEEIHCPFDLAVIGVARL